MALTDKQLQQQWEELRDNIRNATPVDVNETADQRRKRREKLEKNPEEWFKYYFPKFAYSEPAPFHKAATRRIMNNPEWYEVRFWSRELAKSTRSMMEDLYLLLTKRKRYKMLISATYDAAEKLFMPYMVNLEANNRIIADYGPQEKLGSWNKGDIVTKSGFAIRALGKGQSPRGARKDEVRPDIIEFDDFDTDEECLNPQRIDNGWKWVSEAAIPVRSTSTPTLIRWNGNKIAEDCCIVRAAEFADHVSTVNIRDDKGNSTWPQKNTEEHIDRVLKILPWSAQQKEYFNNPFTEGKAFQQVTWGPVPPLSKFHYLIAYGDPSTSNSDKGKGTSGSSHKALVLIGCLNRVYYVIKAVVGHMTNAHYVEWYYEFDRFVNNKAQLFSYIENNTLQEPFFDQVFKPLFFEKSKLYGKMVGIIPDTRKKPDKYTRIEGTLEPLNRLGLLVFNEAMKDDEGMKVLVSQLKSVSPLSKTMDGPDALEGGVFMCTARILAQGG
ncbi:MAG: hypothetical protein EBZ77_07960, partial [Chitinophagia bacterium]|nr:hypothetical protein [Chitinophagia bacterium]